MARARSDAAWRVGIIARGGGALYRRNKVKKKNTTQKYAARGYVAIVRWVSVEDEWEDRRE